MNCMNASTSNSCGFSNKIYCDLIKFSSIESYGPSGSLCLWIFKDYHTFHFYIEGLGNCLDPRNYSDINDIHELVTSLEGNYYFNNIESYDKVSDDYKIHSKKNDGNVCVNVD